MKLRNKKTGEIADSSMNAGAFDIYTVHNKDKSWCYTRPEQICEEWEEYEPAEPLIKDKKICKAVRAWAEAGNIKEVGVVMGREETTFCDDNTDITFYGELPGLIDGADYTIAELCGEEE